MKTSPELSIEDEMRGRTSKLIENVNKNPDSPKDMTYKAKEDVVSQRIPSTPVQEAIKEQKPKEPERKKKPTRTLLELYATGPHTRPRNKLRFKFKLMENLELKDMIINIDEEPLDKHSEMLEYQAFLSECVMFYYFESFPINRVRIY